MTEQAAPLPTATPATSGTLQPPTQSAAEGAAIFNHCLVFIPRGLCLSVGNTSS